MPRIGKRVAVFLLLGIAVLFRASIVQRYVSTSADGNQYYQLSQELIRDGRFSFDRPPAPLTYSRLPGYPLFLAVAVGWAPVSLQTSVFRAACANTVLDFATATFLVFLLLELRLPFRYGCIAFSLVVLCPVLFLFASYQLTESLATCLGMLAFLLALRSHRTGKRLELAGCGVALGAALLVRADMIAELPAVAILVWDRRLALRKNVFQACVIAAGVFVVIAPWGIRNLVHFGSPHLAGAEWPAEDGEPLATGPMKWMRTWAAGRPGDGDLSGRFVFKQKFDSAQAVWPRMYDSRAERRELIEILDDYQQHGLTAPVNDRFIQLAAARWRAHPFRCAVELPLARAAALYRSPPHGDYPIRINFLGLPKYRSQLFDAFNLIMYLSAIAGLVLLYRDRQRRWVANAAVAAVAARTIIHMWAVPTFVCQRYLVEVIPLLLVLASVALGRGTDRLLFRSGRQPSAATETAA